MTGRIAPGEVGEVLVQVRGGSEAFYAYATVGGTVIEKGAKVMVDDYEPPLTVFVSPTEPAPPTAPPRSLVQDTIPAPPRSTVQDTIPNRPAERHSYYS